MNINISETKLSLLVSLNENYLPQLRVMLLSLRVNNPQLLCDVYFLHRGIPEEALSSLSEYLKTLRIELFPIEVDQQLFENAPITNRYPQEMYYRLLAAQLLPSSLDKVLYLDPDILIINSLEPLWQINLGDQLFAAAAHSGKAELIDGVNNLRLGTNGAYYNSGVLLINLAQCRKEICPEEIFRYALEHTAELLLPDQDILNALYGQRIFPLDDLIWNYDARNYHDYKLATHGEADINWIMEHTAILHFCGREKPWKPYYYRRFGVLYRHYMQLTRRMLSDS